MSKSALARRVGIDASYVSLIERAAVRGDQGPSRPSSDVLRRWARALGWNEEYTRLILRHAGHLEPEDADKGDFDPFPQSAGLHFPQPRELEERLLVDQLERILTRAVPEDQWTEASTLLRSFFEWLEFKLDQRGNGN